MLAFTSVLHYLQILLISDCFSSFIYKERSRFPPYVFEFFFIGRARLFNTVFRNHGEESLYIIRRGI